MFSNSGDTLLISLFWPWFLKFKVFIVCVLFLQQVLNHPSFPFKNKMDVVWHLAIINNMVSPEFPELRI